MNLHDKLIGYTKNTLDRIINSGIGIIKVNTKIACILQDINILDEYVKFDPAVNSKIPEPYEIGRTNKIIVLVDPYLAWNDLNIKDMKDNIIGKFENEYIDSFI